MTGRDELLAALLAERYPAQPPRSREAADRPSDPYSNTPGQVVARRRAAAAELDGADPKRHTRRPRRAAS